MKATAKALLTASLALATAPAIACYESTVIKPTPFMGNHGEIFQLIDGSLWQVQGSMEVLVEVMPEAIICPSQNTLIINGRQINVTRLSSGIPRSGGDGARSIIESRIDGEFEGWDGETIVKLTNGQIWQQAEYRYEYKYAYRPRVLIFRTAGGHKMQVEGTRRAVRVKRLR